MNDIEKAIEDLRGLSDRSSIKSELFKERHGKNFNLAISALEKQIPKKPKQYNDFFKTTYYFCPICEYVRITGNQKRCDVCGQKIDWEVENE
jgi:rubrerythrin